MIGDVSWHVAAGQWMIEHGKVPFTDPFSFSAAGKPWVAHEWLSEWSWAWPTSLAGFAGLSALVVAALALLMLVMWKELSRWLRPVITGSILLAVTITIIPFLLARPMVLTWPFVAFWTVQMMRAREGAQAPPLWLAAVMLRVGQLSCELFARVFCSLARFALGGAPRGTGQEARHRRMGRVRPAVRRGVSGEPEHVHHAADADRRVHRQEHHPDPGIQTDRHELHAGL